MNQLFTLDYRRFSFGVVPLSGVVALLLWFAYSTQYWAAAFFFCAVLLYSLISAFLYQPINIDQDRSLDDIWQHLAKIQVRRSRKLTCFGILIACLLPFVSAMASDSSWQHEGAEWVGLVLIFVAIVGRSWSILYLGGRKGASLIDQGPYSISRNPLYFFSVTATVGIGAQSGSLTLGLLLGLFVYIVFDGVIGEEEILLRKVFGTSFDQYRTRVPRFWPKFSNWQSPDELLISVSGLQNTVRDALPYLLSVPVFELIGYAQVSGWFPVLIRLP